MLMREMSRMGVRGLILTSDSNHLTNPPQVEGAEFVETVDGVEVHWVRTLKYCGAKSLGRILSWLHFEGRLWCLPKADLPKPDAIIVSSLSLLTIFNGLWLKRRYRCRLVFEVRDIWPLTLVAEGGFSRLNPLVMALGAVEWLAYRTSDAIVGTMPNLREHVARVLPSHPPVHCIPMGIDDALVGTPDQPFADPPPTAVTDGRFVVCHAGTIGITNGLDTLFDCARSMRAIEDVHFVILGQGDLKAHYEAATADLPNVTFVPAVPKDQVQFFLQGCDLLYFSTIPSPVWNYGQSLNKVIDYMLAGRPVVASYSGFPSMISEAGSGEFAPAGDVEALRNAILRFAAMPVAERLAMGARGRGWLLANRRYERLADEYLSILGLQERGQ
jgi:glycosyltransferase involved in cell wall biosynthesis